MHGEYGLAGAGSPQDSHRSTLVALGQFSLSRVQKNAPLRQWRVEHRHHGFLIRYHDKACLRFRCLNSGSKVFGINGRVNMTFNVFFGVYLT